jgi:hypothetical protein
MIPISNSFVHGNLNSSKKPPMMVSTNFGLYRSTVALMDEEEKAGDTSLPVII